jgi:hypothetical protein
MFAVAFKRGSGCRLDARALNALHRSHLLAVPFEIRTSGDTRTEEPLKSDGELLAAYRENFGISLALVPDRLGRATG